MKRLGQAIIPLAMVLVVGLSTRPGACATGGDDRAVQTADYVVDVEAKDSAVVQASYSTGSSGKKLVWRPYRPSPNKSPSTRPAPPPERVVSFDEPVGKGLAASDPSSPLNDPFEDTTRLTQLVPPANLQDEVLEKPTPKPMPLGKLPAAFSQEVAPKAESTRQSQEIGGKELEEALAVGPQARPFECPSPKDLKPIRKIGYQITPERGELPPECSLGDEQFKPRTWAPITYTWKASSLCHKPFYFEQAHLERYGHTVKWGLQPVVSAAHFFLTVPILPYEMGLYPPDECVYTLGYYRPGDCAPYLLDPLPISIRAALFEAGAWTAGAIVIP